jgi:histidinol-phosphate aminotransferase
VDYDALIRAELGPMRPYSPGLRVSEVREKSGRDDVRKLSSNENPYGPFPGALAGMRAVLGRLNVYPDGAARALKRRICQHLGVAEENMVVGNGSNELLRIIAQAVLAPGDECVFAWPSFVVYPMVCQLMGATEVRVPLGAGEVHDLVAMADAITERTKLVFLCNPNNPTGTIYSRASFDAFLARVPEHVLVVIDEAYFEYAMSPEYPDGLGYFDGLRPLCVLRTFSKMYSLAGARVGYGVLPVPLVSALNKIREPFNVNTVAQVGAYYSLDDQAEVRRRRDENREQKTHLYSCFDRLGVSYVPSETNFVYVHTEKPVEVFQALLSQGVIVRDFGTAPALRVGVGSPDDTRATVAAFEDVVAQLGPL